LFLSEISRICYAWKLLLSWVIDFESFNFTLQFALLSRGEKSTHLEDVVKKFKTKLVLIFFVLLLSAGLEMAAAQAAPPDPPLVNVEGNWAIYSKDWDGRTATKSVQIKQNGNQLTGHFKGPNQSGGIEGTVNGKHIVFRTKTRNVLTFRGMVDGNTMKGTWGIQGRPGEWTATRLNQ
jgi:hypothetical protein